MNIEINLGKYILAVSGGVDSMVLLDLLSKKPGVELVVAHFDHGIRPDSYMDAELVKQTSEKLGLTFELGQGKLGQDASEEAARDARYKFLNEIKAKHNASAIITAHQRDDVIETALINIIRGTGPRGLSSLVTNKAIIRPLLNYTKVEIKNYALKNKIIWREDSTNEDTKYLRNYVRKNIVSKMSEEHKDRIIRNIDKVAKIQISKDQDIAKISQSIKKNDLIDRQLFALLPKEVGSELVGTWLREVGHRKFDKKTIEKANMIIRTARPNTKHDVNKTVEIVVDKLFARFK